MIPQDYAKRFLSQHNPGTSPPALTARSPQTTPTKNRAGNGGDRFIPVRLPSEDWSLRFNALGDKNNTNNTPPKRMAAGGTQNNRGNGDDTNRQETLAHRAILRNELLQAKIDDIRQESASSSSKQVDKSPPSDSPTNQSTSLFQYTPTKGCDSAPSPHKGTPRALAMSSLCSISPLSENSQRLLRSPRKPARKVPKNPYKVLDAPELADDFYLNLVDWSCQNLLCVGLGTSVYLWSASTSQVTKLCDLNSENDSVTSVQWTEKGDQVAVGTQKGLTQVWDVGSQARVHNMMGHTSRVGCLAWNGDLICSGSRDRLILQRDIRTPVGVPERKLNAHKQEVCGLKWSPDHQHLASGGNDNQLLVWSLRKDSPVQTYTQHVAAVKALAWCPHQHGLLVSGGGTADRTLRFWNTVTAQAMQCVDSGSQVCNVAWSRHSNELVSTHGYSQNQIVIWKYPSLQQVAKLTGHSYRVLYLAMSPDGESIVTGAGDETLRFWHVFSKQRTTKDVRSKLNLFTSIR